MSTTSNKAPAVVHEASTTPGSEGSSNWSIRMENIGKQYRLGAVNARSEDSLRDVIANLFTGKKKPTKESKNAFWALRHIDMEIEKGDTVGIIGRNGAGKSTMLKLLSRITSPTEGEMLYKGRLASLLEVGTGFHRELSGRENIFLNGSILGMKRAEITRHFDAIIEFAGVEKFLDTPVKFYSSGMYVRLAFAVAAHLRTDILVVDEVLAVGDAQFQKKCLGKMQDVAGDGRTVLFVSHNMGIVQRLCRRCAHLQKGRMINYGETSSVVKNYLSTDIKPGESEERPSDSSVKIRLRKARIVDSSGTVITQLSRTIKAFVEIDYDVNTACADSHVVCHITDLENNIIISTGDCDEGRDIEKTRQPGRYTTKFPLPNDILNEGSYSVTVATGIPYMDVYDRVRSFVDFQVIDSRDDGGPSYLQRRPGYLAKDIFWEIEKRVDK